MNNETAAIEALVSIAGVIKPVVTESKVERSFDLPDKLVKRLVKWMIDPVLRPFELPPERDHEKLFNVLGSPYSAPPDALTSGYDVLEFEAKVQECRSQLVDKYPVQFARDKLQDIPLELSTDEAQDWLALVSIIEDEFRIVDEIEMGTLLATQVDLYKAAFPEMYSHMAQSANDVIVEMSAAGRQLHPVVESTIEVFLNEWRVSPVETAAEDEQPPERSQVKLSSERAKTQTERTEE